MRLTQEQLHAALVERHGADIQQKLDRAAVGIAGLGGLGSNIAVFLARLGVGRLVLVDFDTVEVSNLNRQHYTMRDLGRPKADALRDQLIEINPYLDYETYTTRVTPENAPQLFADCDVVCEAFDRADQKAMLIETLLAHLPDTPIVSGSGMAGCGSANAIRTERRFTRLYLCGDGTSDIADGVGLMAPRVAVCAAHEATMVLRLLLGYTEP
ncbi:sulfur carrier protein ThiS adenylyltransferase ThiF [Agathobaculum sp. Marseille-P7918]|uniref:sulfur carrier protein ThiS adenylyltransferase ThiF n=1 Tax=Agathobaculum sp. Marseille-P7918 TaxID=2479843 RepID=UPI000F639ABB|nr:sulfur carrier protein ThiS adenylyltransferase ThiF [Agathobaculum sp. Marseille-P7918]